jgi:hypothetical protein
MDDDGFVCVRLPDRAALTVVVRLP